MSLNISPTKQFNNLAITTAGNSSALRAGLEVLKHKNQDQSDDLGLRVNLSARHNSRLTTLLVKDVSSELSASIKANASVHKLDASKVDSLI
ncbi:hypothetical protein OAN13_08065 [Opitutales bacterium]|nr:hypothetical protein [Opitutales bacterium]